MNIDPQMIQPWMLPMLLVYCRIQGCMLAMPGFSERLLPARIKIALAMALSPLFSIGHAAPPAPTPFALAGLAMAEVVTGLLIGGLVRLIAFALPIAATAIATTASLSQILGVANEFSPHPIGNILHLAGLALLMALGFPVMVCELIGESLVLKPLGGWPQAGAVLPAAIALTARSFLLAMLLASPFILGGLLFQGLSGVVSKVMPSLPIVFIGAPAAILLALAALAILTPAILSVWAEAVMQFTLPDLR
ncbi:flagellar biosynthetic protein FliR [uncultured Paracoccus sp.]|uniref:flagellar biosynthetic protein FliR n=1 Tax=uncultured Paracoccus sp. TaxID=189685 RepID=UPI0025CC98EB|nr:flagellar biosynthetic protein FliR [uncultured Paracoccus sp.]